MLIHSQLANNVLTMQLDGDFDADGVQRSREQFEKLCSDASYKEVIIDMQAVDFLDSSGVGALVYVFKRLAAQHIPLRICKVHGQAAELMQLLRMDQAITIEWQKDNVTDLRGLAV